MRTAPGAPGRTPCSRSQRGEKEAPVLADGSTFLQPDEQLQTQLEDISSGQPAPLRWTGVIPWGAEPTRAQNEESPRGDAVASPGNASQCSRLTSGVRASESETRVTPAALPVQHVRPVPSGQGAGGSCALSHIRLVKKHPNLGHISVGRALLSKTGQ